METSKLFDGKAHLYASSRPTYPKELFAFIGSLVESHNEAWDCATGNGQAALGLSQVFRVIEATDISKEQIENAFSVKNVRYSVQPSETTSFSEGQFDLINVAQALHWFDLDRYWEEVRRVLNRQGAFVAYGYTWPEVEDTVDEVVERCVTSVIAPYWAENNRLVWNGYRDVKLPFKRLETPQIDLINHWNMEQFFNYLHTWSATRRCMDNIGTEFFEVAKTEMRKYWGDPREIKVVRNPLTLIAGKVWS